MLSRRTALQASPSRRFLPPFNPEAPPCHSPPGLKKVLAFAQDNEREFMQGVGYGLATAAKDRGLEYRVALANNDAAKMIEQVQAFRAEKIGGLVAAPIDPASLSHSLQQIIWAWWLRRHCGAPASYVPAQCATISDGKGLGRRRRRLHPG